MIDPIKDFQADPAHLFVNTINGEMYIQQGDEVFEMEWDHLEGRFIFVLIKE